MRAGLLTQTIDIQRPTITRNDVGEQVTTYTTLRTIHARIVIDRKSRTTENDEIYSPRTLTMEVRIYQDIKENDLIAYRGKQYRILSIEYDRPLMCQRLTIIENNE